MGFSPFSKDDGSFSFNSPGRGGDDANGMSTEDPQPDAFNHQNDPSINMIPPHPPDDENGMSTEDSQPDAFNHQNDPSINMISPLPTDDENGMSTEDPQLDAFNHQNDPSINTIPPHPPDDENGMSTEDPQPDAFNHQNDPSINTIPPHPPDDENGMSTEDPQPDAFNHQNDPSIDTVPPHPPGRSMQYYTSSYDTVPVGDFLLDNHSTDSTPHNQANSKIKKNPQNRTTFTHQQYEVLEAVFNQVMFPDKLVLRNLAEQLDLQEKTVKVWFRNRRFKWRKLEQQLRQQQQQQQQQPTNLTFLSWDRPTTHTMPTNPCPLYPEASSSRGRLLGPERPLMCLGNSIPTENPTSDPPVQDTGLENLQPSIPALFPDSLDITHIMDLYSFPDDATSTCSFRCLYQYLSPTSRPPGQSPSYGTLGGPAAGASPGESFSSGTNPTRAAQPAVPDIVETTRNARLAPSSAGFAFFNQGTNK